MIDDSLTDSLDGTRMVYTYPEMGTVRVSFAGGSVSFEWLAGLLEGQSGSDFPYRARKVGDDQFFVNWHELEAHGFVTLHVDFQAERVRSSVLAAYATGNEQVFLHSAAIDRVEASNR
tara:strand:+ start:75 stop:428 length:354 start_codon:yes stop_codon:yes gene_type:complete